MDRKIRSPWWGLFALVPIAAALLYLAAEVKVGETLRQVLLIAIVVIVALLALFWSEKHADLMGSDGVDARAEQQDLAERGCTREGLNPSLTGRQAAYRLVMFTRSAAQTSDHTRSARNPQ